ncbi:MAG: glycerate kinase, partial [Planctomycetes bacterium]|nr:glycerate kinase [Planctomycetota bacterium]
QEFALAAARWLARSGAPVTVLACGTDGNDGPTDAAGGLVDAGSWARIAARGLDPERALRRHDAYPALQAAGDLVVTGPTNTNVMDLALAWRA